MGKININPKNKGLLHKKLGVSKGKKIPMKKITKSLDSIKGKEKKGKLSASSLKKERELVFARNAKEGKFKRR